MIIRSFGHALPKRIVTNDELARFLDTSDEWIQSHTGIQSRRVLTGGETLSALGAQAAEMALERAGMTAADIDYILCSTTRGEMFFPSTACLVQQKIGAGCPCLDINAGCTGFLYALDTADALLESGKAKRLLIVCAEQLSRLTDWTDRSTCVLFGDGGGACLLTGADFPRGRDLNAQLTDVISKADGAYTDLLYIRGGGSSLPYKAGDVIGDEYFIHMDGREVYKHAVRSMTAISREILERNGLSSQDIDLVIPHQANQRIIEAVTGRLEVPAERVFMNVHAYGNTSAASIPLALYEAKNEGRLQPGMNVLITTFGAGLAWSSALLRID